jgi:cytochrome P450
MDELGAYLEGIAEERRREPREDLLSALLAAEQEGEKLSADEVYSTIELLLIAGNGFQNPLRILLAHSFLLLLSF